MKDKYNSKVRRLPQRSLRDEDIVGEAIDLGALEAKIILTDTVVTAGWVRLKCQYGCKRYGTLLTCPPYSPPLEEVWEILDEYNEALMIRSDQSWRIRYMVSELERCFLLKGHHKSFGMGSGPCTLCEDCDIDSVCSYPDKARPSMEACGIDVYRTVKNNGWEISTLKHKEDKPDFFGLVLLR